MKILITGCAGYVGSVLTTALAKLDGVAEIVGLDLWPRPDRLRIGKLRWVQADAADGSWRATLGGHGIDAVIHCAYHTREPYGAEHERQRRSNHGGARNVFEFALGEPSVRRLIQFSTVSIYGARPENSPAKPFTEDTPVVPADYLYSRQKQEVEAILRGLYERSDRSRHALIVRPASVSGPYGRHVVNRFGGLVSTLTGRLPAIPVGRRDWCRQYLHEDDLAAIVAMFLTTPRGPGLEVFNLAPDDALSSDDLAALYGKRVLVVPPLLLRAAFGLIWHGTRGAFTTPPGAWRMLTYPIAVDGSRLTRVYGYRYKYSSAEALAAEQGEHAATAVRSAAAPSPRSPLEPIGQHPPSDYSRLHQASGDSAPRAARNRLWRQACSGRLSTRALAGAHSLAGGRVTAREEQTEL
jgi:UDP-glucose 4-epimerase